MSLAIATIVLSWAFIHTMFALHYAHDYYGEGTRQWRLKFPGETSPTTGTSPISPSSIGMTFQVSDVTVTNKAIRRLVLAHGIVSFLFNTALLALTVNIAASAI